MTFAGALLLFLALTSAAIQRAPISAAAVYLAVGLAIGPAWLGWLSIDVVGSASAVETVTCIAVITSLFVGGLRMRQSLQHHAWSAAFRLAGPGMLACIVLVALFAYFVCGLAPWEALLLGAVLAPTDPVLATEVSVSDARDQDEVRYGVSGEAGLNDGLAFPFVVLAIAWKEHGSWGGWVGEWALHRLLWAIPAALLLGYAMGKGVGRLSIWLRTRTRDTRPSDFLALALIALSYVAAEGIGAWGFLCVFAAGFGLRRAEKQVVDASPHPEAEREGPHPPAEHMVGAQVEAEALDAPAVAAGVMVTEVLSFGDALERLMALALVLALGVVLPRHWDPSAIAVAAFLFLFARPLAAQLSLLGSPTSWVQRWIMGWFGIRGLGSIYYLAYALVHGAGTSRLVDITMTVVALSIVAHGLTATPILRRYERSLSDRAQAPAAGA